MLIEPEGHLRSLDHRHSLEGAPVLPHRVPRTFSEAKQLIDDNKLAYIIENFDTVLENLHHQQVMVPEGLINRLRTTFYRQKSEVSQLLLHCFNHSSNPNLLILLNHEYVDQIDLLQQVATNNNHDVLIWVIEGREYFTRVNDEQFIQTLLTVDKAAIYLARNIKKFEEPAQRKLINEFLLKHQYVRVIEMMGSVPQLLNRVLEEKHLEPISLLEYSLTHFDRDVWHTVMTNFGAYTHFFCRNASQRHEAKNIVFAMARKQGENRNDHPAVIQRLLENADVLSELTDQDVEYLAQSKKFINCLEFIDGNTDAKIEASQQRFERSTFHSDRKMELLRYYASNFYFRGLSLLIKHNPDLCYQKENKEEILGMITQAIHRAMTSKNYCTAASGVEAFQNIHISGNEEEMAQSKLQAALGKVSVEELSDLAQNCKLQSALSIREPFPIRNTPHDIAQYYLSGYIFDLLKPYSEGSSTVALDSYGNHFTDHPVVKKNLSFILDTRAEAVLHIKEIFEWMRQYVIQIVEQELAWQKDRRTDEKLLPHGRLLEVNGSPEEIRLFFIRAGQFFSEGWNDNGKFGGKKWKKVCDLGVQFWSRDEKQTDDQTIPQMIFLINQFIATQHNSGNVLNYHHPSLKYDLTVSNEFLAVISELQSPDMVIKHLVDSGALSNSEGLRAESTINKIQHIVSATSTTA